jgi:hypothetical protein
MTTRIGRLRLPFVSCASARFLIYAGWEPNGGFFGFKSNLKNVELQIV